MRRRTAKAKASPTMQFFVSRPTRVGLADTMRCPSIGCRHDDETTIYVVHFVEVAHQDDPEALRS